MTQSTRSLLIAVVLVLVAIAAFVWTLKHRGDEGGSEVAGGRAAAGELSGPGSRPGALEVGDAAQQGKTASSPLRTELEVPKNVTTPRKASGNTIALSGRFVQADGSPGAGVEVRHVAFDADLGLAIGSLGNRDKTVGPKSDAAGRFRVEVPIGQKVTLQLGGRSHLFAPAQGEAGGDSASLEVAASQVDKDLGDLKLVAAALVTGIVQDASGKPLEGARVKVLGDASDLGMFSPWDDGGEKTDAKGTFTIGPLAVGKTRLQASARGHVPTKLEIDLLTGEHKSGVVFQLTAGFAISGRRRD